MFKRRQKGDKEGYYSCGVDVKDLEPGEMTRVKVNGRDLILSRVNDQIYAFDETCPHGAASLAKGSLSRHKISCPDHGYCFDIRTGRIIWPEDEGYTLRHYAAKVVDGQIRLRLGDAQTD